MGQITITQATQWLSEQLKEAAEDASVRVVINDDSNTLLDLQYVEGEEYHLTLERVIHKEEDDVEYEVLAEYTLEPGDKAALGEVIRDYVEDGGEIEDFDGPSYS